MSKTLMHTNNYFFSNFSPVRESSVICIGRGLGSIWPLKIDGNNCIYSIVWIYF